MRGPRGEVYTTMGTRILLLPDGGSVLVTKDETELVKLSVQAPDKRRVDLALTAVDCLGLIEFLAVAARPGSGKELVEMLPDGAEREASPAAKVLVGGREHVRDTSCNCGSCNTCCLFICTVCRGAEASLLPTCPGRRLTASEQDDIVSGKVTSVVDLGPGPGGFPETGTTCADCHEPQFMTPSGITCPKGHGGADSDP